MKTNQFKNGQEPAKIADRDKEFLVRNPPVFPYEPISFWNPGVRWVHGLFTVPAKRKSIFTFKLFIR
jgi:hypothetical protein